MSPDSVEVPSPQDWMLKAQVRKYRKGETIVRAGSAIHELIAITSGAAYVAVRVAAQAKAAIAALWFGDVVGAESILGRSVALYDVTALVDVVTIVLPAAAEGAGSNYLHLYAATAARLNRQIAMRVAGNGPQRLMTVLATLGSAFTAGGARVHRLQALPIGQTCLGELAGLSRRQVWVYLGQLANAGWVRTSRTGVILQDFSCWQALEGAVELRGLECIATIDAAITTLSNLLADSIRGSSASS